MLAGEKDDILGAICFAVVVVAIVGLAALMGG